MTVTIRQNLVNYTGTGTAGPFPIPFPYDSTAELKFTRRDVDYNERDLTLGDGITSIDGTGVTLDEVLTADDRFVIQRKLNPTQETNWVEHSAFTSESLEDALDKITRSIIDCRNDLERLYALALRFPYFSDYRNWRLPRTVVPGGFLRVNTSGTGVEFYSLGAEAYTWADIQGAIDWAIAGLADDTATAFTEGLFHSGVGWTRNSVNGAGDATATQLTNILLPALGPNDAIEIRGSWTHVGASNKHTMIVVGCDVDGAGGTLYCDPTLTTALRNDTFTFISNRGSVDSQYGFTSGSAVTSSIDMSTPQYVSFQAAWEAGVDTHSITLERYSVRVIRP